MADSLTAAVPAGTEPFPDGRHFEIIRFGESRQFDDTHEVTVPPDAYFVLGNNGCRRLVSCRGRTFATT